MDPNHRCKVVGNPGGGPWVFLANPFEGGTWGCEKIRGGRVLLHFYVEVFQKSLKGYMRRPLPPPLCASMIQINFVQFDVIDFLFLSQYN